MNNAYKIPDRKINVRDNSEDPGIEGRIILRRVLEKQLGNLKCDLGTVRPIIEMTGRGPLRRRRSALDCRAI
jgi:hypothetical protein